MEIKNIDINKIKNNNVDYGLVAYNFTKKEP